MLERDEDFESLLDDGNETPQDTKYNTQREKTFKLQSIY